MSSALCRACIRRCLKFRMSHSEHCLVRIPLCSGSCSILSMCMCCCILLFLFRHTRIALFRWCLHCIRLGFGKGRFLPIFLDCRFVPDIRIFHMSRSYACYLLFHRSRCQCCRKWSHLAGNTSHNFLHCSLASYCFGTSALSRSMLPVGSGNMQPQHPCIGLCLPQLQLC